MGRVFWLVAVMVCVMGGEAWAGALIPPKDADTCTDGTGALAWVETGGEQRFGLRQSGARDSG